MDTRSPPKLNLADTSEWLKNSARVAVMFLDENMDVVKTCHDLTHEDLTVLAAAKWELEHPLTYEVADPQPTPNGGVWCHYGTTDPWVPEEPGTRFKSAIAVSDSEIRRMGYANRHLFVKALGDHYEHADWLIIKGYCDER